MIVKFLGAGFLAIMMAACSLTSTGTGKLQRRIIISQYPTHQEISRYHIGPLEQFSLSFIHSVSKTHVRDEYIIEHTKIIQVTEIFEAHGAGLPSDALDAGAVGWEHRDGQFILRLRRPIPRLIVQTDRNYQNRLQLGELSIDLNQWENQALELRIEIDSSE